MKDEEKTIDQIIADLEKMEKETAAKKLKEQGDDVEKDIVFEEGALEEFAEEPIEELTLEEPILELEEPLEEKPLEIQPEKSSLKEPGEEVPFDEAQETPFDEAQEVPFDKAREAPFEKVEETLLEKPLEESLVEAPPEDLPREEPSSEVPPVQTISSMEQALPPEGPPPEEPGDEPPDEPPALPPKKRSLPVSRTTLILLLFLISFGLYAYFVYPTMYENRTMRSGDKTYPVKINRLTKSMQYYEMGKWYNGPIPKTSTYRARLTIPSKARVAPAEKKPLKAVEEAPVKALEKAPAEEPAKAAVKTAPEAPVEAVVKTPEKQSVETITKAPEETAVKTPDAAPVPSVEPSPEKKIEKAIEKAEKKAEKPEEVAIVQAELPPREEIVKPVKKYIYAIQISSMRFNEFAEEFLEDLERKGLDVHMRVIETKKHGLWYTIYIGHFADREEAVTYMKEKKITDSYPGSCIRKMSNR